MRKRHQSPYLVRWFNLFSIYRMLDYGLWYSIRAAFRSAGRC
jgi:hypothetical protein